VKYNLSVTFCGALFSSNRLEKKIGSGRPRSASHILSKKITMPSVA